MNRRSADAEPLVVHPPASEWRGPMPDSRPQQVTFFRREGFLILRELVDPGTLLELRAEIDRIAAASRQASNLPGGLNLEQVQDPQRAAPAFRKIGGISRQSEAFARLARHPRLVEMLRALLGPVVELYRDVAMMKAARVGRQKPWHQDSVYWPWHPMDLVSVMTAIDDATASNGCLQIIPRTHTRVLQHFGDEQQIEPDASMRERTVGVPLRAGDALLFHSLLLHASEPNRSDRDRRVVICAYKNPQMRFIGEGAPPECPVIE